MIDLEKITPADTPEKIRALCDEMWAATHTGDLPPVEVATRLSFLSGIAMYALLAYAKSMEPTTEPGERV